MGYIYLILLFIMLYTSYNGICISKKAPKKIKILTNVCMWGMFVRTLVLTIMYAFQNLAYLYILKPIVFLNLICMPIIACIVLCILARNNKINFSYLFIMAFLLIGLYVLFFLKLDINIMIHKDFGYIAHVVNGKYMYIFGLVIYTLCLLWSIILFKSKNFNKVLIIFTIIVCGLSIFEIITNIESRALMPNLLISQSLWLTLLDYILYKIKK